jgi:hypothetical protein
LLCLRILKLLITFDVIASSMKEYDEGVSAVDSVFIRV